jgi:small-conductance mechanosensitive channel
LVRDTLLEIIANARNVRKYPTPDVLFCDHGDSALIFNLRFWTEVEGFLITESNIRFEITRLFKEREIEIAFPQLDVHLHNQLPDA